jgi:hypothetical protein
MRLIHIMALSSAIAAPASAAVTNYSVHKQPSITLPAAGGAYVDPTFGSKIIRVTDSRNGTNCTHAYSYWSAMNMNDTQFILACDGVVKLYKMNPATDQVTYVRPLRGTDGAKLQFEGLQWSHTDPNVLYGLDQTGFRLWKINTQTQGQAGYALIRDFTASFPSTSYLAQLDMDESADVFTFHSRDRKSGEKLKAAAYQRSTNKLYILPTPSGAKVDESKTDKLGRGVMVNFDDDRWIWWNFRANTYQWFYPEKAADCASGHYDLGSTVIANTDPFNTGICVRNYTTMHAAKNVVRYLRPNGTLNWTIAEHPSLRNNNEKWVMVSTYGGDSTWDAFTKEIFLVNTNGTGFARLAHTRSTGSSSYWSQPRVSVSYTGHYAVFTSDLGSSTRHDVLILKVPSVYW